MSHPIVVFPETPEVLDLRGADPEPPRGAYSIGKYDEVRGIYTQALFAGSRCVHMGIDLGAPAKTPVHAFDGGTIAFAGVNEAQGDYGPTLVCRHDFEGRPLYVLLGHLAGESLQHSPVGRSFVAGEVLGWLGAPSENGGWPPHVHVQLSWRNPKTHDMLGAVEICDRESAKKLYPDPALIGCGLPHAAH